MEYLGSTKGDKTLTDAYTTSKLELGWLTPYTWRGMCDFCKSIHEFHNGRCNNDNPSGDQLKDPEFAKTYRVHKPAVKEYEYNPFKLPEPEEKKKNVVSLMPLFPDKMSMPEMPSSFNPNIPKVTKIVEDEEPEIDEKFEESDAYHSMTKVEKLRYRKTMWWKSQTGIKKN